MEPTQDKLLGVASGLFAEKGFAAVSMRDIATASGITQAAIYHHFANKEALYRASVRYLLEQKLAPLSATTASAQSPETRLSMLVGGMMRLSLDNPQFGRIYYRELLDGDDRRLLALAEDVLVDLKRLLDEIVAELAPAADTHLALVSLMGMIVHHIEVIKLGPLLPWGKPEHGELAVLSDHVSGLFINGLKGS